MSKTETQSDALTAERRLFITAVANLELRKKFGDEGFRLDLERDELEALIEMAERVSRLDAENKALRELLGASPAVPHGFALVPVVPTRRMLDVGRWSGAGSVSIQEEWARKEVWHRMLAAAPQAAAKTGDAA